MGCVLPNPSHPILPNGCQGETNGKFRELVPHTHGIQEFRRKYVFLGSLLDRSGSTSYKSFSPNRWALKDFHKSFSLMRWLNDFRRCFCPPAHSLPLLKGSTIPSSACGPFSSRPSFLPRNWGTGPLVAHPFWVAGLFREPPAADGSVPFRP